MVAPTPSVFRRIRARDYPPAVEGALEWAVLLGMAAVYPFALAFAVLVFLARKVVDLRGCARRRS